MTVQEAINDFVQDCEVRGLASHTVRWRRSVLKTLSNWEVLPGQALGSLSLSEVSSRTLGKFVVYLRKREGLYISHPYPGKQRKGRLRGSTIMAMIKVLKTFFNWCTYKRHLFEESPSRPLPLKNIPSGEPKSLTLEELRQVVTAAENIGPREAALVRFLADTGARLGEVASLTLDRLDIDNGTALVVGKGGKRRFVFFIPPTARALRKYLDDPRRLALAERSSSKAVFWGQKGPLTYRGLWGIIRSVGKEAGVDFYPHQLRHTFSIMSMEEGASLAAVADWLGHADVRLTKQIYGIFDIGSLKRQHDRFTPARKLDI